MLKCKKWMERFYFIHKERSKELNEHEITFGFIKGTIYLTLIITDYHEDCFEESKYMKNEEIGLCKRSWQICVNFNFALWKVGLL